MICPEVVLAVIPTVEFVVHVVGAQMTTAVKAIEVIKDEGVMVSVDDTSHQGGALLGWTWKPF